MSAVRSPYDTRDPFAVPSLLLEELETEARRLETSVSPGYVIGKIANYLARIDDQHIDPEQVPEVKARLSWLASCLEPSLKRTGFVGDEARVLDGIVQSLNDHQAIVESTLDLYSDELLATRQAFRLELSYLMSH
jgi:hypothetical protein